MEARYDEREALAKRVKRVRAWQQFESEGFLASDMEAVLTLAESALGKRPEPGVSFDPPYRIEYIDGGDAVLLPFRVIDCAGNVRSLVLTAERAVEMHDALEAALRVPVGEGGAVSGRADPPFEPGVQHTDRNPAPPLHQDGCDEWCAHCALCGTAVLWGARCNDHLGVYPDRRNTPV